MKLNYNLVSLLFDKKPVKSKSRIYFKIVCVFFYYFYTYPCKDGIFMIYTIYTHYFRGFYIALSSAPFFSILFPSPGPLLQHLCFYLPSFLLRNKPNPWATNCSLSIDVFRLHPHKCFLLFLKVFLVVKIVITCLHSDFVSVTVYVCVCRY